MSAVGVFKDWRFVISTAIALAGVFVSLWIYQAERESKRLIVRVASKIPLQPMQENEVLSDLKVTVGGTPLESPYVSVIEVLNAGTKPIPSADVEEPVEIAVANATLIRAKTSAKYPPNIKALVEVSGNKIRLLPTLLNPADQLSVAVITAGGAPTFAASARIVGISKIENVEGDEDKLDVERAAIFSIIAILMLIPGMALQRRADFPFPVVPGPLISIRRRTALVASITLVSIAAVSIQVAFRTHQIWMVAIGVVIFAFAAAPFSSWLERAPGDLSGKRG